MGGFTATGYTVAGHAITFRYNDSACDMVCECGWTVRIRSYPNPWGVQEVQRRFEEHLLDRGAEAL